MVGIGILHKAQALAGGIDLAQGDPYGFAILGRDQRISSAEDAGEPRLDLRQQGQRGFTTTRPHSAHTGTVKIKGMLNPGQRGRQKSGMPPEAEAHHLDGGLRVTSPEPADCGGDISKDLLAGGGVLMAAPFSQIGGGVGQLQIRSRAGEQRHRQGRIPLGGHAIRHAAHPGVQPQTPPEARYIHVLNSNVMRYRSH